MRFRFCGDLDAPDWILAEVTILSKMSSVRMKLICRQVLQQLLGRGIDYEKVQKLTTSHRIQLDVADVKALVAALHFVLSNAAKYDVDSNVLLMELQQLGLPRDICAVICHEFNVAKTELRSVLVSQTLSLPQVVRADWRVNYVLASSKMQTVNEPSVSLQFHLSKPIVDGSSSSSSSPLTLPMELSATKFRLLHSELLAARQIMDSLQA